MHGERRNGEKGANLIELRVGFVLKHGLAALSQSHEHRRSSEYVIAGAYRSLHDILYGPLAFFHRYDDLSAGTCLHGLGNLYRHLIVRRGALGRFIGNPGFRLGGRHPNTKCGRSYNDGPDNGLHTDVLLWFYEFKTT